MKLQVSSTPGVVPPPDYTGWKLGRIRVCESTSVRRLGTSAFHEKVCYAQRWRAGVPTAASARSPKRGVELCLCENKTTTFCGCKGSFMSAPEKPQLQRWCATWAHVSCGVKVPVVAGQTPRCVSSVGLPAEPGGEQRRLSVHRECRRPQGEPQSPEAIQLRNYD